MWYDDEDDDDDGDDDDGDDDDDDYDDVGLSTHASQIAFQTRVLAKHRFNLQKRQRPSACNQRTCACATAISRMTQCLDFTIDMYHNTARKKRQKSMLTPWLLEGKPVLARCLFFVLPDDSCYPTPGNQPFERIAWTMIIGAGGIRLRIAPAF